MAKASLKLSNGTHVEIDGTVDEVHKLLTLYSQGKSIPAQTGSPKAGRKRSGKQTPGRTRSKQEDAPDEDGVDLTEIVHQIKDGDQADEIADHILDKVSLVNRVLLPLYIVHEHMGNKRGLTSGEISKVTTDLGVRVSQPNASSYLSGSAKRYVIGDKVRRKGEPVRYKLSRKGLQYVKSVLKGTKDEE
jgi:hypothetical protein